MLLLSSLAATTGPPALSTPNLLDDEDPDVDFATVAKDVLAEVGTAAVIVAVLGVLGKIAITKFFDAGITTLKANLQRSNDTELANVKSGLASKLLEEKNAFALKLLEEKGLADRERDRLRQGIADRAAADDRIRAEVLAWANPVLAAVRQLERRLDNILLKDGFVGLDPNFAQPDPNWSLKHDYFFTRSD